MIDCGHVFCRQCLQDFYSNAIAEGDLASIKCLTPDCARERSNTANSPTGRRRKPKTRISPGELLQIPIEQEMVKRYVTLKHKAELESDKNTIYCPRKWCQGAARSRKHRKPSQLLNDNDSSGEESESENEASGPKTGYRAWAELLSVCEDCSFAFCSRCYQGWHGEFTLCTPRTNTGELTDEDKASLEYLKLHTTPCPTCAAPAQKTHGCNHMICFKCETHFCYLCSAWLEPANPYQHYNLVTTSCYMRLWELEGGDGDDVGIGFVGGVQAREAAVHEIEVNAVQPAAVRPVARNIVVDAPPEPPANPEQPLAQPVAREGPLVLRIGQIPPRVPPAPQRANVQNPIQHRGPGRPQPDRRPAGNGYAERPAGGRHAEVAAHRRRFRADQQVRHARLARNAAPPPARNAVPLAPQVAAAQAAGQVVIPANDAADANQRWVENFVRMALADEEDLIEWDSDDEEDVEWQIPVR
jgi:E3 ubiquitin-protein ligase RNF14